MDKRGVAVIETAYCPLPAEAMRELMQFRITRPMLCPVVDLVDDAIYLGFELRFWRMWSAGLRKGHNNQADRVLMPTIGEITKLTDVLDLAPQGKLVRQCYALNMMPCWRCGADLRWPNGPTRAHIIDRASNGTYSPRNFFLLCDRCHRRQPEAEPGSRLQQIEWLASGYPWHPWQ